MAPSRRRLSGFTQGFTLIELLVVIAIIAILTAILLPVFNSVREGSRQSVSISNMKDIQQKMEQFKLDNHKYPDVLFGYVYHQNGLASGAVIPMTKALNQVTTDHQADLQSNVTNPVVLASHNPANYFPGLYPAYIKDPNVFTDPNNQTDSNSPGQSTPALTDAYVIAPCSKLNDNTLRGDGNSMCETPSYGSGTAIPTVRYFYTVDAYDSSPAVTAGNTINSGNYVTRYQTAREGTACSAANKPDGCDPSIMLNNPQVAANYKRQLRWQNPPADTLVTLTSYHVQNADKVLVIFASGAVKKVKAEDFLNPNTDTAASFWTTTP